MIQKTKRYEMFKFRDDNRLKIDRNHVNKLVESIRSRNLLELRPIDVNENMEILDGQHRVLAAKELGVEIYYKIQKELTQNDIILMNVTKNWTVSDYLNYYVKNQYIEYVKFLRFIEKNQISIRLGLALTYGKGHDIHKKFREGTYVFREEEINKEIETCWDTIHLIKQFNGHCFFLSTARFWQALMKLIRHPDFDNEHWKKNLKKMIERVSVRVSEKDYLKMMTEIYNWRHNLKIKFIEEEIYE